VEFEGWTAAGVLRERHRSWRRPAVAKPATHQSLSTEPELAAVDAFAAEPHVVWEVRVHELDVDQVGVSLLDESGATLHPGPGELDVDPNRGLAGDTDRGGR